MLDRQKNKVYSWEEQHVIPFDRNRIDIKLVPSLVNYIWADCGLSYPPEVGLLPDNHKLAGSGDRLEVCFKKETYTWIVLHELAHSMTTRHDGPSNLHGSIYMGIYLKLLNKYLKIDYNSMIESTGKFGIKVKQDAVVV